MSEILVKELKAVGKSLLMWEQKDWHGDAVLSAIRAQVMFIYKHCKSIYQSEFGYQQNSQSKSNVLFRKWYEMIHG